MKRYLSLTIAIMMFVAVVAVSAAAQVSGTQRMRARIPFAFNVGAKSLPAGEYNVTVLNPMSDRKVLQIRSIDGRVSAIVQTSQLNANTSEQASHAFSRLVFNRYGDQYFFAQAQIAGDTITLAAVRSNAERTTAQAIASEGQKGTVAVEARSAERRGKRDVGF